METRTGGLQENIDVAIARKKDVAIARNQGFNKNKIDCN
jgi:hypothetical protein